MRNIFKKNNNSERTDDGAAFEENEPQACKGTTYSNDESQVCGGAATFYDEPRMRGGTIGSHDENAPKKIESEDMEAFDVTMSFYSLVLPAEMSGMWKRINNFTAFATKAGDNTFIFLETDEGAHSSNGKRSEWALIEDDIFHELASLTLKHNFAASNGRSSYTYGLPMNFGGSVNIKYAGGEKIYFSNNQSPVISYDAGVDIVAVFRKAFEGKKAVFPDLSGLRQIEFAEARKNCGFTKATLTINPDGTGTNEKIQRFDGPKIFESCKEVDAETVQAIKNSIENNGILAWELLPDNGFELRAEKELTFVFEGGEEICIKSDRLLPMQLQGGFFDIELEMTTKH